MKKGADRGKELKALPPPSYTQPASAYYRVADLWSPEITGNWRIDTSQGKVYADELVAQIRESNNPTILGHLIKSMIGKGSWSGVEVGFFHRCSEYLLDEPRAERAELTLPTACTGDSEV